MSTSLFAQFHFGDPAGDVPGSESSARKMARRELRHLVNNGVLKCVPMRKDRGAPENIYCLTETKVSRNLLFMPHYLRICGVAMTIRAACVLPRDEAYSFDFLLDYELMRKSRDRKGEERPDLVFSIASSKGRGLYLTEVDLSSEPLKASDRKRASIYKKLEWCTGLAEDDLDRYRETFDYDFKGARVTVVTSRPESLIRACRQVGTRDVVGVADLSDVIVESVIDGKIWTVPGLAEGRKFLLNWHPDDLGDG